MTNPIKRFFQILKSLVLFPISFLQVRRAYQEMEKIQKLSEDPEKLRKVFAKMGLEDEMTGLYNPILPPNFNKKPMTEVDLMYLDEEEEDEEKEFND